MTTKFENFLFFQEERRQIDRKYKMGKTKKMIVPFESRVDVFFVTTSVIQVRIFTADWTAGGLEIKIDHLDLSMNLLCINHSHSVG